MDKQLVSQLRWLYGISERYISLKLIDHGMNTMITLGPGMTGEIVPFILVASHHLFSITITIALTHFWHILFTIRIYIHHHNLYHKCSDLSRN